MKDSVLMEVLKSYLHMKLFHIGGESFEVCNKQEGWGGF
jgi:hypothetical protein